MGVLDDEERRGAHRGLGEEVEHRERDQEGLRAVAAPEADGRRERLALRVRQRVEAGEGRLDELLEGCERHRGLGRDPGGAEYTEPAGRCRAGRGLDERRLADPGLAAEEQGGAAAVGGAREQYLDGRELALAAEQRRHGAPLGWAVVLYTGRAHGAPRVPAVIRLKRHAGAGVV